MDKIQKIVHATVVEMQAIQRKPKDCYKATEHRLWGYPVLIANIERYKLDIEDLKKEKITCKSKDITSWGGMGIRLTPEEKQEAKVMSVQYKLERDSTEVATIDGCLARLEDDDAKFIRQVFFSGMTSEQFDMSTATFQRRRGKLIRRLAIMLYGADALD